MDLLSYDSLVIHWAVRFGARSPVKDSQQYADGWIGLLHASRHYSPERVSKRTGKPILFSTYASLCIRRTIISGYQQWKGRDQRKRKGFFKVDFPKGLIVDSGEPGESWDVLEAIDDLPEASEEASHNELVALVLRKLDSLPGSWREAVKGRLLKEASYQEIADSLGMNSKQRAQQVVSHTLSLLQRRIGHLA